MMIEEKSSWNSLPINADNNTSEIFVYGTGSIFPVQLIYWLIA